MSIKQLIVEAKVSLTPSLKTEIFQAVSSIKQSPFGSNASSHTAVYFPVGVFTGIPTGIFTAGTSTL